MQLEVLTVDSGFCGCSEKTAAGSLVRPITQRPSSNLLDFEAVIANIVYQPQTWNIIMKVVGGPASLLRALQPTCRRSCISPLTQYRQDRNQASHRSKSRHLSTTSTYHAMAAPEINFETHQFDPKPRTARVVPASPSYFTGKPDFTDSLLHLQALLRKYQLLPVYPPGKAPRVAWRTLPQYRIHIGEEVQASKYQKIVKVLHRLNQIHSSLMPPEVRTTLDDYKRDVNPYANVARPRTIDEHGRALGVGRRKSATARVWVVEGDGEVLVNGKGLHTAFGRIHDRESAVWALKATQRIDKYNVWALVEGGGTTGQAEALTLGVAKALLVHEPLLKPALRRGESSHSSWSSFSADITTSCRWFLYCISWLASASLAFCQGLRSSLHVLTNWEES